MMRLLRSQLIALSTLAFILTAGDGLTACQTKQIETVKYPDGRTEIHLDGEAAELFRQLTGHGAMTPSERLTVYGTENPPTLQLECHERQHQVDAEAIADLLIEHGFLRPSDRHRFVAWIAVYLANHIDGYEKNLLEERARKMCEKVPDIPPPNQPASEKSGD